MERKARTLKYQNRTSKKYSKRFREKLIDLICNKNFPESLVSVPGMPTSLNSVASRDTVEFNKEISFYDIEAPKNNDHQFNRKEVKV